MVTKHDKVLTHGTRFSTQTLNSSLASFNRLKRVCEIIFTKKSMKMLDIDSSKQEIPQVYVNITYKKKLFQKYDCKKINIK